MTADSFNPLTDTPPSSQPASEPEAGVVDPDRQRGDVRRYGAVPDVESKPLSLPPVPALPDSESPGLTDDERVLLEKYRALTPDCGYHMITAVKGVLVTYPEFNRLQAAASTPDSDTRWYCPDCDEHHATAELTATPESHQPACPDCGHEVEMEWTDKDFVVPDSDTLPPSETPEVTDVAPAVREEAVRTAARVRDRAKAGEYEMGALDAAVLARGVLLLDAALTCATTSPKVSAASELERLKEDSLKCTICGEPKICANGGCIGDD